MRWGYKYVQTPDGRWLRSENKCPMVYSNREYHSPEPHLCFSARVWFHHPKGQWRESEDNYPIYHISGAEYHDDRGVKFFEQESNRKSTSKNEITNKQDPTAIQPPRNRKNNNKYNTTCIRCGLISHRSTLCPTYPHSKT